MTNPIDDKKMIEEYFLGKRCLLVDPSSTTRITMRKLLTDYKVDNADIYNAESFRVAINYIKEKKPHFIFSVFKIQNSSFLDLLSLHTEIHPNRLNASFYILSSENDLYAKNALLENDIDAIFTLPFTIDSLKKSFAKSIEQKICPTPYVTLVEKGREYYFLKDNDNAEISFKNAIPLDPKPFSALSLLGVLYRNAGKTADAKSFFEQALTLKDDHYKSLRNLADISLQLEEYERAYQLNAKILDNYPLNPEKIPDLTRLSIVTKRYEDILNYVTIFNKLSENPNDILQKYISAALAICGKYLFSKNNPADDARGLDALRQAAKLSNGKKEILRSIVKTLINAKKLDDANKILDQFADENTSQDDFIMMKLEILDDLSKDPIDILNLGSRLVLKKYNNLKLYQIMVKRSIEAKRTRNKIETLISQAILLFPGEKDYFEEILQNLDP